MFIAVVSITNTVFQSDIHVQPLNISTDIIDVKNQIKCPRIPESSSSGSMTTRSTKKKVEENIGHHASFARENHRSSPSFVEQLLILQGTFNVFTNQSKFEHFMFSCCHVKSPSCSFCLLDLVSALS